VPTPKSPQRLNSRIGNRTAPGTGPFYRRSGSDLGSKTCDTGAGLDKKKEVSRSGRGTLREADTPTEKGKYFFLLGGKRSKGKSSPLKKKRNQHSLGTSLSMQTQKHHCRRGRLKNQKRIDVSIELLNECPQLRQSITLTGRVLIISTKSDLREKAPLPGRRRRNGDLLTGAGKDQTRTERKSTPDFGTQATS